MSMIFQEPMTSLNPVFRIGDQMDEVIELHNVQLSKEEVKERTIEMLELVGCQFRKVFIKCIHMSCPVVCVKEL